MGRPFVSGDPRQRPGPGRPPSKIREALRLALSDRLPVLQQLADDESAGWPDRLRAMEMMAKYGLGTTTTVTDSEGQDVAAPVVLLPTRQTL